MASEYRHGNSPGFYPINMPGIGRVGNVTLRNGIFSNDNRFWRLHDEIELNATPKRTIFVNLLDESGNPTMTWTLNHARPTRMSGVDVKVEGIEVAVESIEVAYETFAVVLVSSP